MNKEFAKKTGAALLAILGFLGLSAQSCEGPKPKGEVFSIDRPPLAQTLGCPDGTWLIKVLTPEVANNKSLSPDQKAAQLKKVCAKPAEAARYTVGGQYP